MVIQVCYIFSEILCRVTANVLLIKHSHGTDTIATTEKVLHAKRSSHFRHFNTFCKILLCKFQFFILQLTSSFLLLLFIYFLVVSGFLTLSSLSDNTGVAKIHFLFVLRNILLDIFTGFQIKENRF